MPDVAIEEELRNPSRTAWFMVSAIATLAGAVAAAAYAVTLFTHVAGDCGVVRFYEQLFGVFILGLWLLGSAVGTWLAVYGFRKRSKAVISAAIITVIVGLGMVLFHVKTVRDIREADFTIKSVEQLLQILEEGNPDEQMHAAYELGERKTEAAIPILCALVSDKTGDTHLRLNALRSLGQICSSLQRDTGSYEHAFAFIVKTLSENSEERENELRSKAAGILAEIHDKRAVGPLSNLLQVEEDEYVRDDVIEALRSISDEGADEILADEGKVDRPIEMEDRVEQPGHVPVSVDADLFYEKPSILWRFKAGNNFWYNSAIVHDGVVYIGCHDGKFYAVDGRSGAPRWEFKTGSEIMSRYPVSDGKRIFLGSTDGHVYAISMKTGKPVWRKRFGRTGTSCSPCLVGDTIIFGGGDGSVTALNRETGDVEWVSRLVSDPFPGLYFEHLASNGEIVCGIAQSTIHVMEAATGKPLWSKPLKTRLDCCYPVALAYGALFHVDPVGTGTMCIARDPKTGKRTWKFAAQDYVLNTGAGVPCATNGKVFVVMDDLLALDAVSGDVVWRTQVEIGGFSSRPLSWPM
ncbi:PQQ-binding-like beta-propeller repeat protein, partial [Candidatus Hydrogenedentota bacterium]